MWTVVSLVGGDVGQMTLQRGGPGQHSIYPTCIHQSSNSVPKTNRKEHTMSFNTGFAVVSGRRHPI